jgi:ArsR family transcriptional regulator
MSKNPTKVDCAGVTGAVNQGAEGCSDICGSVAARSAANHANCHIAAGPPPLEPFRFVRRRRLRIFEAISATGQMNCGEIVSLRGVTPATVSHHLKILSEARLIACRREGQFVYSQAVPETIATYVQALGQMARGKKKLRR